MNQLTHEGLSLRDPRRQGKRERLSEQETSGDYRLRSFRPFGFVLGRFGACEAARTMTI